MTLDQKNTIVLMRTERYSYKAISDAIGVPKETVKSFCRRNNLGKEYIQTAAEEKTGICPQCGNPVAINQKTKRKRFCSPNCRMLWWNSHPEMVQRKALYVFTCAGCGKSFSSYGNAKRKYCSHKCYVSSRFGRQ